MSRKPSIRCILFKAMSKPKDDCWFTLVAVGNNTLRQMTKTMFKMGGIKGVKSNHSLRATRATRLYKEGVVNN